MLFDNDSLDFSRQLIARRITKPQMALALYPSNTGSTSLSVNVTSTTVQVRYVSGATTTETISYVGLSVQELCSKISALNLPIKALPLSSDSVLTSGDLVSTGTFKLIPGDFSVTDRTSDASGAVIRSKKYSVRDRDNASIKLLEPYSDSNTLPWYPRIRAGKIVQKYKGRNLVYYVPEYERQSWSLIYGKPFVTISDTSPSLIDTRTIKLQRSPIYWNNNNFVIYNGDIPLHSSYIKDVDIYNGILYLKDTVHINPDQLSVNYTYIEKSYIYKEVNLNGHYSQNPLILNKYVVVYIVPSEGYSSTTVKRSIYHAIGDSIQSAIDSIPVNESDIPYLVLGAYSIQNTYDSSTVSLLDTRVFGGGLVRSKGPRSTLHRIEELEEPGIREIEDFYIEGRNYADIGSIKGEPYPGSASVIFDIPSSTRDYLSDKDIESRATKFTAAGIASVIEFSDRGLPSVSGLSSQVSAFINGNLDCNLSGAGWIPDRYSIPGGTVYSTWTTEDLNINYPVRPAGTGNILTANSSTGWFQYYLKSSPDCGIEWEERDLIFTSGSKQPFSYTEWRLKRRIDKRDVIEGQLVKGCFHALAENSYKEYRNIKVNAPYRLDNINSLSGQIEDTLAEISESYDSLVSSSLSGYLRYYVSNIQTRDVDFVSDYFGTHSGQSFLYDTPDGSLITSYSGALESVGARLVDSFTTGSFKYYSAYADTVYDTVFSSDTSIVTFTDHLLNLGKYCKYLRNTYGTSDASYLSGMSALTGLLPRVEVLSGAFLADYNITSESDSGPMTSTGINFLYPEANGYMLSECKDSVSEDYRLLEMLPSVMSSMNGFDTLTGINLATFSVYTGIKEVVLSQMNRVASAAFGERTYNGVTVAQSWYANYNRYGKYLAGYLKDLTTAYDLVKDRIFTEYSGSILPYTNSASGTDPQTLDLIYKAIQTGLSGGYDGVRESVLRNGIVHPGLCHVIKAYGWYANRAAEHAAQYGYTGNQDTLARYSGLYISGALSMIKNEVWFDGTMHETIFVDGTKGPAEPKVPVLIFDLLSEGVELNPGLIKPYIQGVLNNITGNYNSNGTYWRDSLKQNPLGSREFDLTGPLTRVYNRL